MKKQKEALKSVRQFKFEKDCYWVGFTPYQVFTDGKILPLNGLGCEKDIKLLREKLKAQNEN